MALGHRNSRRSSADPYQADLERFAEAANGVYSVCFADWDEVRRMLDALRDGDPRAASYVNPIREFLNRVNCASRKQAPLCFTCEQTFLRKTRPLIIAVILPYCDQPPNGIVGGFCATCAVTRAGWPAPGWHDRVAELITPILQQVWGPEARFADAFHLNKLGNG